MELDPICCLAVDESTERRVFHRGKTYYFCSERCRGRFLATPDEDKPALLSRSQGNHTCARHPEFWQEDPSDCPKCRMEQAGHAVCPDRTVRSGMTHALAFQVLGATRPSLLDQFKGLMSGLRRDPPRPTGLRPSPSNSPPV
jgi:YHS domain-containing protein